MSRSVTLDDQHFKVVADKARQRGLTLEQYLQSLIDADSRTFDEILAPARAEFESMTDEELDAIWERARKSARAPEPPSQSNSNEPESSIR